jgi:hypothetical protein
VSVEGITQSREYWRLIATVPAGSASSTQCGPGLSGPAASTAFPPSCDTEARLRPFTAGPACRHTVVPVPSRGSIDTRTGVWPPPAGGGAAPEASAHTATIPACFHRNVNARIGLQRSSFVQRTIPYTRFTGRFTKL